MPINSRELMIVVGRLTDKKNMRVPKSEPAKGLLSFGAGCLAGGLLGGPFGLAVGGTIGAFAGMNMGKFRPLSDIIRHEITERQREKLKNQILAALSDFHATDMDVLLPLLMENVAAQQTVLKTVVSFATNEMCLKVIE